MSETFSSVDIERGWAIRAAAKVVPAVRRMLKQYKELTTAYASVSQHFELLSAHHDELKTSSEVQATKLEAKKSELKELGSRFALVSTALSARTTHSDKYQRFQELLHNEMLPFTNTVDVLTNEAEAVTRLKAMDDQLRLLDSMAKFQSKTVVAVSGGFSSGKSSFISSLFTDNQIQLPIGVQPVTAIPTYVFHSEQSRIVGYSKQGGKVEIEPALYAQLSHEMIKTFDFNLRDVLPFVALQTPLERYNHLAFIDLPGYNPGEQTENIAGDEASAAEFMTQAQCVLWVIGLDANGSISRSDIDFLYQYAQHSRLYIVLNKADLKPLSDVRSVLDEVADTLNLEGIPYEGISAYSSEWGKELAYEQKSIVDLLDDWNQPKETYRELLKELDEIFSEYEQAFQEDIEGRKGKLSLVKALELDLFELGAFEEKQLNEELDLSQYRRKSKGKKQRTRSGIFSMMLPRAMEAEDEEDVVTKKSKVKPDTDDMRLDKIGSVKQHLGDLRSAYNVADRELQLDQLQRIWKDMRTLLS